MAPIFGATVSASTYPTATSTWNAAQLFDGYLGAPWAETCEKIYWTEGQVAPAQLGDTKGSSLLANGCKLVVSIKPSRVQSVAEYNNLVAILNLYKPYQPNIDIILWQEPDNGGASGPFATPAAYQNYVQYYGPAVRAAGFPLCYDPSMGVESNAISYYPGDANCDKIGADYYCESFVKDNSTLAGLIALAANHSGGPVPFSLYEIGYSAENKVPTLSEFTSWLYYQVQLPLLNYVAVGGSIDKVLWYGVFNNWNYIGPQTPGAQITAMLNLQTAVTGGQASGPPVPLPDYPDYQREQDIANTIATTGAPAVILPGIPIASTPLTIQPGQKVKLSPVPIAQPVYELQISGAIPAAATIPFLDVELQWQEMISGLNVSDDKAMFACGTTPNSNTYISRGPTKGNLLLVSVKNTDPVQVASVNILLLVSSRGYGRDIWRQVTTNNPPGYIYAADESVYNAIGALSNFSIAAGNSVSRLFPLYAGDVGFYADQLGIPAASGLLQLQRIPTSVFGTAALWSAEPGGGVGQGVSATLRWPRVPVLLTYSNGGAAAAVINASATALDEHR